MEQCLAVVEAIKKMLQDDGIDIVEEKKMEEVNDAPAPVTEITAARVSALCIMLSSYDIADSTWCYS